VWLIVKKTTTATINNKNVQRVFNVQQYNNTGKQQSTCMAQQQNKAQ